MGRGSHVANAPRCDSGKLDGGGYGIYIVNDTKAFIRIPA